MSAPALPGAFVFFAPPHGLDSMPGRNVTGVVPCSGAPDPRCLTTKRITRFRHIMPPLVRASRARPPAPAAEHTHGQAKLPAPPCAMQLARPRSTIEPYRQRVSAATPLEALMKRRAINGDEADAFSHYWRKRLKWLGRAGVRSRIKRQARRRERHQAKTVIRQEAP